MYGCENVTDEVLSVMLEMCGERLHWLYVQYTAVSSSFEENLRASRPNLKIGYETIFQNPALLP